MGLIHKKYCLYIRKWWFCYGKLGHNLKVKNMCFRNADDEYSGSPLVISGQTQTFGGVVNMILKITYFYIINLHFPYHALSVMLQTTKHMIVSMVSVWLAHLLHSLPTGQDIVMLGIFGGCNR